MGEDHKMDRDGPHRDHGPRDSEWLHLEVTRSIYADADRMAHEAARDLMREAIRAKLRERISAELDAIAELVADAVVRDLEANLAVESALDARREEREALEQRVRDVFAARRDGSAPVKPAGPEAKASGKRARKTASRKRSRS